MASKSGRICVQVVFAFFNFIYLLLSIAVILLAISLGTGSILPPYDVNIFDLTAILESPFLLIACAIMFGTSILALLLSIVGFIAAVKMGRYLLRIMFMIFIIFFLVKFAGIVLVALYAGKDFPASLARTQSASTMLQEKYNSTERFTTAFDRFQTQKRCCGIDSRRDFLNGIVPESCCEDEMPLETCKTFDNGCRSQLTDFVLLEIVGLSGGLISLSVLELLLMMSSALLLRVKLKEDYDNFDNSRT